MSQIERRLIELGITLPQTAAPIGAYVPALVDGDRVWTSGQLPFVDGVLPATGKVGVGPGLITPDDAAALARVSALNAIAAIKFAVGDLDRVLRIVKVVGFVACDPSFSGHPSVVNGASELFAEVFGEAGVHARSAVGVSALPMDAPVEVEVIARIRG